MASLAYPSTIIMVGINIIPLALVWIGRWDGFDLLLAYWWEGLVIAIVALLKGSVVRARTPATAEATFNVFDLPVGAYIIIVATTSTLYLFGLSSLALTFDGSLVSLNHILDPSVGELFTWVGRELFAGGLIFYVMAQAIPYAYSFASDFLRRAEYQRVHEVFESALIRITVIDVMVLVLVVMSISTRWFPVWLVVLIKMVIDGLLHGIERIGSNPSDRVPSSPSPGV